MQVFTIRKLDASEVGKIREIDRAEFIDGVYFVEDDEIRLKPAAIDVKGWEANEVERLIERQVKLLDDGGTVFGIFDGEALVAAASVEGKLRGSSEEYRNLDIMYVSKSFQNQGLGAQLMNLCKEEAKKFGATKLYISASDSRNTIDFYVKHGAILAEEVDEELFEKEPEDIHLEITL